jgi:predicted transcriptional regulator
MGQKLKKELRSQIRDLIIHEINFENMTISQLSKELNVSRQTVSDALTQDRASLERLIEIGEYFFEIELIITKREKRKMKTNEFVFEKNKFLSSVSCLNDFVTYQYLSEAYDMASENEEPFSFEDVLKSAKELSLCHFDQSKDQHKDFSICNFPNVESIKDEIQGKIDNGSTPEIEFLIMHNKSIAYVRALCVAMNEYYESEYEFSVSEGYLGPVIHARLA